MFNNLLPHPATIRKSYKVVNGNAGFTSEAFNAIELRVKNRKQLLIFNVKLILMRWQYEDNCHILMVNCMVVWIWELAILKMTRIMFRKLL